MAPYFETAKSFADVPITDGGVDTATFLLASTDFVNMFDLLGGGVFAFVQNDLRSNLAGVRRRFGDSEGESFTLEKLAVHERETKGANDRHGTACLVRLLRGLWFTCEALRNMQADRNAELHLCFRRAFDLVLKPHVPYLLRPVITIAIRAVPHRHDFYSKIGQGASDEKLDGELTRWLDGLDTILDRMRAFLGDGGYGRM
ncbi:glycolipid transfer protein [Epithele typhae]|uniref:glycolipid transfer protein n=1 Tax=Epithele typhae TaxID=378194 RepID=UPI0020078C0D|nr:glycolipid transfer protein [Epithele typhae]KAH9940790.1 glycolipid transfer protein [Epithele typhae]